MDVDVYDPWASEEEVYNEFGIHLVQNIEDKEYEAIIHTVSHNEFNDIDFKSLKKNKAIIYDVKGTLLDEDVNKRL